MSETLQALRAAITSYTEARPGESPLATSVPGVILLRSNQVKRPTHLIFRPALCVVVQGAKWAIFGDRRLDYRAGQALLVNVEMPAFGRVAEASPTEPYLGVIIEFDLPILREVLEQLPHPLKPSGAAGAGVFVVDLDGSLLDCTLRLLRLQNTPEAIPILYPSILREICYWLLTGPYGGEVARIVLGSSHSQGIISAIYALRSRFTEPVRIEELARTAHMSPSAFHRQFKALTSMTPLQYQKQLRLIEARHLMMTDAANAEGAAMRVGYESPSQFNREYTRMFGAPPRRDISRLRELASYGEIPSA